MPQLRLPSNWGTFTSHQKFCYLVNSNQARDMSHAAKLLNMLKKDNNVKKKLINKELFNNCSLPYKDS